MSGEGRSAETGDLRAAADWLRRATAHLSDTERHEGITLIDAALRSSKAQAWNEGWRAGRGRGRPGHTDACPIGGSRGDNPYRGVVSPPGSPDSHESLGMAR